NSDATSERAGVSRGGAAPLAVPVLSPVEAARKAAAQGNADAQFRLSLALFEGKDAARDEVEATRWLRLAAQAGHGEAQYALGFRHANGQGVPQNDVEAVAWFRKAAEQNHAVAQC